MITALSLFSGIGGFDLAFEAAGVQIVAQVENNPYCQRVLRHHWPHVRLHSDIKEVNFGIYQGVDIVFGGFPCQDISIAGKGAGLDGERSGLWREFARAIKEARPRAVVIENVPAITVAGRGGVEVVGFLASMGYDAVWGRVSAIQTGAPQIRERFWLVAYANGQRYNESDVATKLQDYKKWDATPSGHGWGRKPSAVIAGAKILGYANGAGLEGADGAKPSFTGVTRPTRRFTGHPHKPRMGGNADGLSQRLAEHQWPAGPLSPRYPFEPPTLIQDKGPYWKEEINALGNAVVPQAFMEIASAVVKLLSLEISNGG